MTFGYIETVSRVHPIYLGIHLLAGAAVTSRFAEQGEEQKKGPHSGGGSRGVWYLLVYIKCMYK